jgi:hypothetical protein
MLNQRPDGLIRKSASRPEIFTSVSDEKRLILPHMLVPDSAGEKPRSAKTSPLPLVIVIPLRVLMSFPICLQHGGAALSTAGIRQRGLAVAAAFVS